MTARSRGELPTAVVKVDAQHRVVLPRLIRDTAIIGAGDVLVAFADGRGRIVLETRAAVTSELRAMYAAGRGDPQSGGDTNTRLRRTRDEDALADAEKEERLLADRGFRGQSE